MSPKPGNQQHVLICPAKAIMPASPCKVVRKRIVSFPQSLCIGFHSRLKCIYSGSLFPKAWLKTPRKRLNSSAIFIAETAKANGIDFYQYLVKLFTDLPNLPIYQKPEILKDYMPWPKNIRESCAK